MIIVAIIIIMIIAIIVIIIILMKWFSLFCQQIFKSYALHPSLEPQSHHCCNKTISFINSTSILLLLLLHLYIIYINTTSIGDLRLSKAALGLPQTERTRVSTSPRSLERGNDIFTWVMPFQRCKDMLHFPDLWRSCAMHNVHFCRKLTRRGRRREKRTVQVSPPFICQVAFFWTSLILLWSSFLSEEEVATFFFAE